MYIYIMYTRKRSRSKEKK